MSSEILRLTIHWLAGVCITFICGEESRQSMGTHMEELAKTVLASDRSALGIG
jgi:hypothetical protein